jgi:hypothetical protein
MTIFGMKFYISDLALVLLAVFYLPLVLWALWKIVRTKAVTGWRKGVVFVIAVLAAYAIPLGDVTINSLGMRDACKRAGLHVYRQVAVEGYIDSNTSADMLAKHHEYYPYRFFEYPTSKGGFKHHERLPDGSVVTTVREQPEAEYEVVDDNPRSLPGLRVGNIARGQVRHLKSGEVLGEWLTLGPRHGWIDGIVLLGWFGQGLPGCTQSFEQKRQLAFWEQQVLLPKLKTDR